MANVTQLRDTAVISLVANPNLADVSSRQEHFRRWADATEKARDAFERWLFERDRSAFVTPPRENRQSTPVFTVHASPEVIRLLHDPGQRPACVDDVEEPAEFGIIGP